MRAQLKMQQFEMKSEANAHECAVCARLDRDRAFSFLLIILYSFEMSLALAVGALHALSQTSNFAATSPRHIMPPVRAFLPSNVRALV